MNIDKNALESLSTLSDEQLKQLLRLAVGSESAAISDKSISGLRRVISEATDSDIKRAAELISAYQKGKRGSENGTERK